MDDGALRRRRQYSDISGSLAIAAATDDQTLVTGRINYSIWIQSINVTITAGSAGKTWTFKDSAGTPILITPAVDVSVGGQANYDFGSTGVQLTQDKNFLLDVSAAGAVGQVTWEGYQRLNTTINENSTANTAN
jgi:hypothetical protein